MCLLRCLLIFVLVLQSCISAKDSKVKEFISSKLTNAIWEYNTTKDYVLCFEDTEKSASGVVKYLVMRIEDRFIIEEGNFRPGYIKWINGDEVEVRSLPGALKNDNDSNQYTKIISVRKKQ